MLLCPSHACNARRIVTGLGQGESTDRGERSG
jgi:hypothetical protein